MSPTKKSIRYFLSESNKIEDVHDKKSLEDALKAWNYIMEYDEITPFLVREVHSILMSDQGLEKKHVGQWRSVPVWIGGDKKSDPPLIIQDKVEHWCKHVNEVIKTKSKNHQIPICCHVSFEEIHPFIDGNGRVGRILMNWQALKLETPLITYTSDDRQTYYRLFPSYRAKEMTVLQEYLFRRNFDL